MDDLALVIGNKNYSSPVVLRFRTHEVKLDDRLQEHCATIVALPALEEWMAAARAESWTVDDFEYPAIEP